MVVAYRINRPDTAFSLSPAKGKRRPRERDDRHLAWLRTLPCLITGTRPVDPCHIRFADPRYAKPHSGAGEKPHDKWTVPMCREKHDEQHAMNEKLFWAKYAIDPCQVASALWGVTGDDEAAEIILAQARQTASTMVKP